MDATLLDECVSSCPRASPRHSHRSVASGFSPSLSRWLQSTICNGMFAVAVFYFPIQQSMCFEYNSTLHPSLLLGRPTSPSFCSSICFIHFLWEDTQKLYVTLDLISDTTTTSRKEKLLKVFAAEAPPKLVLCFILSFFSSKRKRREKS